MTLNEKAKDLKSSGYVLTACGAAGLLVMLLIFAGVIPLSLGGVFGVITKLVMSLLFVIFLVTGIISLKKSGAVFDDAKRETDKKNEIKKWFMETYDAYALDSVLDTGMEANDLYFERTDLIKDKICERFMDVEDALMSELTEEIYTELFEQGQMVQGYDDAYAGQETVIQE